MKYLTLRWGNVSDIYFSDTTLVDLESTSKETNNSESLKVQQGGEIKPLDEAYTDGNVTGFRTGLH